MSTARRPHPGMLESAGPAADLLTFGGAARNGGWRLQGKEEAKHNRHIGVIVHEPASGRRRARDGDEVMHVKPSGCNEA